MQQFSTDNAKNVYRKWKKLSLHVQHSEGSGTEFSKYFVSGKYLIIFAFW